MADLAACYSSDSTEWETPQWLFDLLDDRYRFTLDVCATRENAKCLNYYTEKDNGLRRKWEGSVWCNPPYGREIVHWVERAAKQVRFKRVRRVVMLLPARVDTKWWHGHVMHHARGMHFIEGRLKFVGAKGSAPFPSLVVVYDKRVSGLFVSTTINARTKSWELPTERVSDGIVV